MTKPVTMERLRMTLARWLPLGAGSQMPGVTAAAGNEPIDLDVLGAWLGDDRAGIDWLLAKLRGSAAALGTAIDVAWHCGDFATLAAEAHKLKGLAQSVGANDVGRAAAALEQAGKGRRSDGCRDGLGPLADELRRIMAESVRTRSRLD